MAEILREGDYRDHYSVVVEMLEDEVIDRIESIERMGKLPAFIEDTLSEWSIKNHPRVEFVRDVMSHVPKARTEEFFATYWISVTTSELVKDTFSPRN